ncbi:MAG: BatD family protein, partial [bacterium]|nr:BatD family protein [bacterium]
KDFISEEIIKERQYEVDLDGRRYAVNEWRLALFPTQAGELSTGIAKVEATVPVRVGPSRRPDPFFRSFPMRSRLENRTFQAGNQRINVKPLPPAPPDFTGLVGEFNIESSLDHQQMKTGETAHLKVNITGKGNIRDANLPNMEENSFFKIYPANPKVEVDKSLQGISGKKEFDFAMVAQRPGMATVGPLETSYFNPTTESFEKLTVPAQGILIQGGGSEEPLVTAGIDQPAGIFPETAPKTQWYGIKDTYDLLLTQVPSPVATGFWWVLILGTPLSYLIVLLWQKRKERLEAMAEDRKRSKAFRKAKAALGGLSGAHTQKYSEELSQILREYLGDVFAVKGLALTPSEVEDLLKSRKVPAEEVRRMVYMLEQLDAWKYGGWAEQLPEGKSLKQEILHLLREIEKVL